MKATLQAITAALLAGMVVAGALVWSPRALADEAEDAYLDHLYEFSDILILDDEDDQFLIDQGHRFCDETAKGEPEQFVVTLLALQEPWLTMDDAQFVYDSAMEFLC